MPNQFIFTSPIGDGNVYAMDVHDIGGCVEYIFNNPNEFRSKVVPVASEKLKVSDIINIMNEHLAPNTFFDGKLTVEKFRSFGFPGVEDMAAMFEYIETGKLTRDVDLTRRINKDVSTFEEWIVQNKEEILASLAAK